MARVQIRPLSKRLRAVPERFRPSPPPLFPDGEPTAADIALARDLFDALDADSQAWYRNTRLFREVYKPKPKTRGKK